VYWLPDSPVVSLATGTTGPSAASSRRILRTADLGETAARNGRTDRGGRSSGER
jgi:hypothetical protein